MRINHKDNYHAINFIPLSDEKPNIIEIYNSFRDKTHVISEFTYSERLGVISLSFPFVAKKDESYKITVKNDNKRLFLGIIYAI